MAKRSFPFTTSRLDRLKNEMGKTIEYSDANERGLRLQVSPSGSKVYYVRLQVNNRKITIRLGNASLICLQEARQRAREVKIKIEQGLDPREEKARQESIPTVRAFIEDQYLAHAKANKKSWRDDKCRLEKGLLAEYGDLKMDVLTTAMIQVFHDKAKERWCPATANRHFAVIHHALGCAVRWGVIAINPSHGIRRHRENNQRKRYLSSEEISRLVKACDSDKHFSVAMLIKFLLYTGLRRGEAMFAKWDQADLENATLWLPQTKAGEGRFVLLNDIALDVLKKMPHIEGHNYIFPGRSAGEPIKEPKFTFARIKKNAGITALRIHDLRHTYASLAVNGGASLYEVQHLLGHKSSQTTTRYAHLMDESLRRASQAVSDSISNAVQHA